MTVSIGNGLIRIDSDIYPLAAVSSLSIRRRWYPIGGFFLAGVFGTFAHLTFALGGGIFALLPLFVATGGLGMMIPRYQLVIGAAGGERVALTANSRTEVEGLRAKIEREFGAAFSTVGSDIALR